MKREVITIISTLLGTAVGAGIVGKLSNETINKEKNMSEKHLALFLLMNQWVKLKQEGKSLVSYFEENKYKKIAVYGISYAGETLLGELKGTEVQVAYGIDHNTDGIYTDIEVVSLEDSLEPVDVIVVTAITYFEEVKEKLRKKVNCPIISLDDILYEI